MRHRRVDGVDDPANGSDSVVLAGLRGTDVVEDLLQQNEGFLQVLQEEVCRLLEHFSEAIGDVSVDFSLPKRDKGDERAEELLGIVGSIAGTPLEALRKTPSHLHVVVDVFSFLQVFEHVRV